MKYEVILLLYPSSFIFNPLLNFYECNSLNSASGYLGGLTLLLTQNWTPAISLVFLGMRTQALPLAMWMLFATAAGALTSVFITSLFKISNYFVRQPRQTRFKSATTSARNKTTFRKEPTPPQLVRHRQLAKPQILPAMNLTTGIQIIKMMTGILSRTRGKHLKQDSKLKMMTTIKPTNVRNNRKVLLNLVQCIPTTTATPKIRQ